MHVCPNPLPENCQTPYSGLNKSVCSCPSSFSRTARRLSIPQPGVNGWMMQAKVKAKGCPSALGSRETSSLTWQHHPSPGNGSPRDGLLPDEKLTLLPQSTSHADPCTAALSSVGVCSLAVLSCLKKHHFFEMIVSVKVWQTSF